MAGLAYYYRLQREAQPPSDTSLPDELTHFYVRFECMARHDSHTIIKFADDTTVVGLLTDNDKTTYGKEVRDLASWCQNNTLSLNVTKA